MYTDFGTRIPQGLEGYEDGLSGNVFKKIGKAVKKVAKSKVVKVVAGAAAAYYGGKAIKKLVTKAPKVAKAAKGVTGAVKKTVKKKAKSNVIDKITKFGKSKKGKSNVIDKITKFGKSKKGKATFAAGGAALLAAGSRGKNRGNKGRMVKDPFTGEPVNYDTLNPAMQDRVLMQQGSQVNSNGVPFGSGQTENPAFASQKIDIPQSAPFEYAKPISQKSDQYFPQSQGDESQQQYGSPAAGSFFSDPKMLAIAVGLGALFLMTAKKGAH